MAKLREADRMERLEAVAEHTLHLVHTLYAMLIASLPEHKRELKDGARQTKTTLRLIKKAPKHAQDVAKVLLLAVLLAA